MKYETFCLDEPWDGTWFWSNLSNSNRASTLCSSISAGCIDGHKGEEEGQGVGKSKVKGAEGRCGALSIPICGILVLSHRPDFSAQYSQCVVKQDISGLGFGSSDAVSGVPAVKA